MELEQVSAQLAAIAGQLTNMVQKQTEHDEVLKYLSHKIEASPPSPVEEVRSNRQVADIFRIPDPIKSIPNFDGNRKQITAWLKTVEDTLRMFEPLVPPTQFTMYVQAVKNKIEGKARDILCLAGDPETFLEVKQILLDALGDKQELTFYKSLLWSTKQNDNMTIHSYFNKIKETVQNIKSLSRQNRIYNESWAAVSAFIEEDALAAFIAGLKKPYFGYAQAAKPKCIEEAYAFLCKFSSNELISNNSNKINHTNNVPHRTNTSNNHQPKFNAVQQKDREFNQPNNRKQSYSVRNSPSTPMDVDVSMRSRNTYNNKMSINNNEINGDTQEYPPQPTTSDCYQEAADPDTENFQESLNSDTED